VLRQNMAAASNVIGQANNLTVYTLCTFNVLQFEGFIFTRFLIKKFIH
jgi:hypothetical protein